MKLRHQIVGGLIVVGSLATVGTASAFAGPAEPGAGRTSAAKERPSKEYICEHQDEAATRLQGRIDRMNTAIAKLTERRATAVEAGHDQVVARIDRMLTRANKRLGASQQRLADLPAWISEHC